MDRDRLRGRVRLSGRQPTDCLADNLQHWEMHVDDPTETARRERLAEINAEPGSREALEAQYGQVWSTQELGEDFQVLGFMAPYVVVRRKSDGVRGSLEFQHDPRLYFRWEPEQTKPPSFERTPANVPNGTR